MRLINVDTLKLEQFVEPYVPSYGILSHTWTDNEADYQSFTRASLEDIHRASIFYKIRECARLAANDYLQYIWIDTCCIDKSSSAELQEAINSMYRWYEKSYVCYVYLEDHDHSKPFDLSGCRWTTRGWTLQELIAPKMVEFYDKDWHLIAHKNRDIAKCVEATQINTEVLVDSKKLEKVSIAEKMCWASRRQCTRVEDHAYSLMGLFGVNMPMLYGEGERAFIRLQEEIIRTTFDMSIFAWTTTVLNEALHSGLLSPRLACFRSCANIASRTSFNSGSPYYVTNLGMQIQAELIPEEWEPGLYLLRLVDCGKKPQSGALLGNAGFSTELALHVKRLSPRSHHFARVDSHKLFHWSPPNTTVDRPAPIYIRQIPLISRSELISRVDRICLGTMKIDLANHINTRSLPLPILGVWPHSDWFEEERTFLLAPSKEESRAAIWYQSRAGLSGEYNTRVILVGFEPNKPIRLSVCDEGIHDLVRVITDDGEMNSRIHKLLDKSVVKADNYGGYTYQGEHDEETFSLHILTDARWQDSRLFLNIRVQESHTCYY